MSELKPLVARPKSGLKQPSTKVKQCQARKVGGAEVKSISVNALPGESACFGHPGLTWHWSGLG